MRCKYFLLVLLLAMLVLSFPAMASDIKVNIDGNQVSFPDQKPYIDNGRTLVPVRFISEELGAQVIWFEEYDMIDIYLDEDYGVCLYINETRAVRFRVVSSEVVKRYTLDVAPKIVNGRTMVPLRFVSEVLGAKVDWDGNARIINISTNN